MGPDVGHVFVRERAAAVAWGLCGLTALVAVSTLLLLANGVGESTPGRLVRPRRLWRAVPPRGLAHLRNHRGARGYSSAREADRLDFLPDGPPGRRRRSRLPVRGLRPALLPPPLRRSANARELRLAPARRGRSRFAWRRASRRRHRDDAAGACVALAAGRGGGQMSHRTARRLAWGLVALALTLLVSSTVVYAAGGSGVSLSFFIWAIALVFAGVGAMIATRHPGNAIGWIFLSVAVTAGLAEVAHAYADYWVGGNGGSEALARPRRGTGPLWTLSSCPRRPPPAVPGRPPALSTLAADRMVRRAGDRGRVRDAGPDPGAAGLSAADEPTG